MDEVFCTFNLNGKTVGRLIVNNGKLAFDGELDASAEAFFRVLCKRIEEGEEDPADWWKKAIDE